MTEDDSIDPADVPEVVWYQRENGSGKALVPEGAADRLRREGARLERQKLIAMFMSDDMYSPVQPLRRADRLLAADAIRRLDHHRPW